MSEWAVSYLFVGHYFEGLPFRRAAISISHQKSNLFYIDDKTVLVKC